MFNFFGKKKSNESPSIKNEFQPLDKEELASFYSKQITDIYRSSGTTSTNFKTYFLPLLKEYLFFFQSVPAVKYNPYDRLNGMAELMLISVNNGLKIRSGLVIPSGLRADLIDTQKSRWSYLTVVALMRSVINDNVNHFFVEAKKSEQFEPWTFTSGSIGEFSSYRFRKHTTKDKVMDSVVSNYLVSQLVAKEAIFWLSEFDNVFTEYMGIVGTGSKRADNLGMFLNLDKVLPTIKKVADTEVDVVADTEVDVVAGTEVDAVADTEVDAVADTGIDRDVFVAWLSDGLDSGSLLMNTNNAAAHAVEEGLFVTDLAISKYIAANAGVDPDDLHSCLAETSKAVSYDGYGGVLNGYLLSDEFPILEFAPINEDIIFQD